MTNTAVPNAGFRLGKPLTLAAMSLGFGVVQLDVTIVNTALDSIGTSLGGGVSELQWVVSIYTIAFAALILTAGAFGGSFWCQEDLYSGLRGIHDRFARLCARADGDDPDCGAGGARRGRRDASAELARAPQPRLSEARERGRAVGWWLAGASVALTAGPPVGGVLIAITGWRSIFLVNLPIGLAGLWQTWRYVAETPRTSRELDWLGQATAIGSLGMLAAALIEGGRIGWSSLWVIAAVGAALVLTVLFVVQERRAREPMLPLSLFAHPVFARTTIAGLLVNVPFYGLIFVFSLYFQRINGLSPLATGLAFVPMMGIVLPVNLLAPRLAERFGGPAIVAAGALTSACGCLALLGIGHGTSYWALFVQLIAIGGGLALSVPPLTSALRTRDTIHRHT